MPVRFYIESDRDRWDHYVEESDACSAYLFSGWKRVVEKSFGHRTFYLLSEGREGRIDGILPLVHMKSLLFGNFLISLPYFNYGGICADHQNGRDQLLEESIRLAEKENVEFIEFRDAQFYGDGLTVKTHKVSMHLPLPPSVDELWRSFPAKLRSQIIRPQKEGMVVRIGRFEELDGFYRVFSLNMRDLGTPVYSKQFFKNILEEFPESTWICSVFHGKQPIASALILKAKGSMEVPWASSLRSFNRYSPNMFLYWNLLKFSCENGCGLFDFGRSTPGEGTYRFKEQWGAKPVQLYWHYWVRERASLPELNPKNEKYHRAIQIWQRLPVGVTTFIGPMIVKNIP